MAIDITLFVFLAVCVFTDLKVRKVYNSAVIAAVILGFGLNYFSGGLSGLGYSLLGCLAGFSFLFLFYVFGGIGAGDVKFMAAVGCIKGLKFVLMGGLYGAVLGGVAAVVIMAFEKKLFGTLKNIFISILTVITLRVPRIAGFGTGTASFLPYTVFLALGIVLRWVEMTYLTR